MILHIIPRQQWEQAQQAGIYQADSLDTEGFVHCSTPAQVAKVANAFFAGQSGLLLLCIDPDRVRAEIRYDAVEDDHFPHIYGPLNLDAVLEAIAFEPNANGQFSQPQLSDND